MIKFSSNTGYVTCGQCGARIAISTNEIEDEAFTEMLDDGSVTITHILRTSGECRRCEFSIPIEGTFLETESCVSIESDWNSEDGEDLMMPRVYKYSVDDNIDDD